MDLYFILPHLWLMLFYIFRLITAMTMIQVWLLSSIFQLYAISMSSEIELEEIGFSELVFSCRNWCIQLLKNWRPQMLVLPWQNNRFWYLQVFLFFGIYQTDSGICLVETPFYLVWIIVSLHKVDFKEIFKHTPSNFFFFFCLFIFFNL